MATTSFYPLSTKEGLLKEFVGRSIKDVAVPAAVLDLAKVKNNCSHMLEAVESLNFGWRAHIKTHKTTELTRLQVGEGSGPANIIVSTILEAEQIVRLLLEYKSAGRALLYGFPITQTAVKRLALISKALGPKSLSLMVDHPDQLPNVITLQELSGNVPSIFLKIDIGCHRAGVTPQTSACSTLISSLLELEKAGKLHLLGLYAHAGQSYSSSAASDALDYLRQEFEALLVTAIELRNISPSHPLVLSVGATPTTNSIRNLLHNDSKITGTIPLSPVQTAALALRATIDLIRANECSIEIHAGVYTTLDIQQLVTRALPTSGPNAMMTWDDLALTVIAEVASIYPNRGQKNTPEILINAGVIALARETCRVYSGFGILSPWNREGVSPPTTGPETHTGWTVSRISQEHGILTWNGSQANQEIPEAEMLKIGQKIRIWPNHSCIAGAGFGWYLVVDGGDEIVDVWPRWRGW
ncbi:related to alanine racemase [Rhynchosporium graminicola]|uniref:Related to alanine racemase n=1 Tax=Rhynchosporium graminicola TaxID=2792576 RepID=A0A1E1L203_9HELO|nr:related to alanine racemase [Rhynchosporium commune]